jgi:hypothetical protein
MNQKNERPLRVVNDHEPAFISREAESSSVGPSSSGVAHLAGQGRPEPIGRVRPIELCGHRHDPELSHVEVIVEVDFAVQLRDVQADPVVAQVVNEQRGPCDRARQSIHAPIADPLDLASPEAFEDLGEVLPALEVRPAARIEHRDDRCGACARCSRST